MRSNISMEETMSKLVLMALLSVSCVTFAADKKAMKKEAAPATTADATREPNQVGTTYTCTVVKNSYAAEQDASQCNGLAAVATTRENLACCPAEGGGTTPARAGGR
jgi:hypothetical protein